MHHQRWYGDLLEVRGEIGLGEGHDAVVVRLDASHHALAPPVLNDAFRGFRARPVKTVEGTRRQVAIELRPVGSDLYLKSVEYFLRQTAWIGGRFDHDGWHCADEHCLGHATLAVARNIV